MREILVESEIIGPSAVNGKLPNGLYIVCGQRPNIVIALLLGVLSGNHYNGSVRAHKIVFEALSRLRWEQFQQSLELSLRTDTLRMLTAVRTKVAADTVDALISHCEFSSLYDLFCNFVDIEQNPTVEYWKSYCNLVRLLQTFLRSTREGNWSVHLQCIRCFLTWMFAYDRANYSRYLSLYWCDMQLLPEVCPEAYRLLESGECAVQRSTNAFAQMPVDQAIEQSINKDTKVAGGIIGKSLKPSAVQRWMLTAHNLAKTTAACELLANSRCTSEAAHKETSKTRILRNEDDVNRAANLLQRSAINPVKSSTNSDLINIITASVASSDVKRDVANAFEIGDAPFHETLPLLKLKSFASIKKSSKVSVRYLEIAIVADRNFFARLLVISQNRKMDLQYVLSFLWVRFL